jgi:Ca2+-binding EF-hand superfamily protein
MGRFLHVSQMQGAADRIGSKIYVGPIMIAIRVFACTSVAVLLLIACTGLGGGLRQMPGQNPAAVELEQKIRLMLSYDENSDGMVTRAELEAGLRRQFVAADVNRYGYLDAKEMQAENDLRYRAFGVSYSPLIDWHQNGKIDFDEFAATARSVFEELDKNHDGKLDKDELRFPQPGRAGPAAGQTGRRGQSDTR